MAGFADGPKSGRMGFGWDQAWKSGAPFIAPRNGVQMNASLKERKAARELNELVKQKPELGPRVAAMARKLPVASLILYYLDPDHPDVFGFFD